MTIRSVRKGDTVKIVSSFTNKATGAAVPINDYDFNSVVKSKTNSYPVTTDESQSTLGILTHIIDTSIMEYGTYNWNVRLTKGAESFSTQPVQLVVLEEIS